MIRNIFGLKFKLRNILLLMSILIFTLYTVYLAFNSNSAYAGKAPSKKQESVLYPIIVNGKYGFINRQGKEVVKPIYDYIGEFSEGAARVCKKNSNKVSGNQSCGYINLLGKEFIPLKYDAYAGKFSDGIAKVCKTIGNIQKCGFIDKTGKEVIPLKYDDIWGFSEGLAVAKQNNKWGYIDKTGKEVIPLKFDMAYSFSEGLAPIKENNKWKYINKIGITTINIGEYDNVGTFSKGAAAIKQSNKWGFINKTGKVVIKPQYDFVNNFSEGLAFVGNEVKHDARTIRMGGFIDQNGILKIKLIEMSDYESNKQFINGLIYDKSCNYIDKTGKVVLNLAKSGFSRVGYMGRCQNFSSDGLLIVSYGGKPNSYGNRNRNWGYINTKGKLAIKAPVVIDSYSWNYLMERDNDDVIPIYNFSEGLAKVEILYKSGPNKISSKIGFINKKGLFAIKPRFTLGCNRGFGMLDVSLYWDYRDSGFYKGLARVQDFNGYGYIDKKGNWVWHRKYSKQDLLHCNK